MEFVHLRVFSGRPKFPFRGEAERIDLEIKTAQFISPITFFERSDEDDCYTSELTGHERSS